MVQFEGEIDSLLGTLGEMQLNSASPDQDYFEKKEEIEEQIEELTAIKEDI